jgi:hypothetical protein
MQYTQQTDTRISRLRVFFGTKFLLQNLFNSFLRNVVDYSTKCREVMVKSLLLIILMVAATASAEGQILRELRGFVRMKSKPIFYRKTPVIINSQDNALPYWQGSSYTNFSENGRLKNTLSFDIHGQLRESFSSINLKKSGVLSYWRIQFSPIRTRPMLVYTIH